MADFPKDYFQEETKDGFFIEAMMKCAWAAEIEVLEVLDALCAKYDLRYFAAYGTLLGTIRHKGFIPWDDDMDIFMFREDYNRLLSIPIEEWPTGFAVHSIHENNFHSQLFASLVNSTKIDYSPEHLRRFHGCPYMVGLDIFPLDTLSDKESETTAQRDLLNIAIQAHQIYQQYPAAAMELLPQIENLCHVRFDKERDLKNQLMQVIENICQLYSNSPTGDVTFFINFNKYGLRMKREWFDQTLRMPFETVTIPVPAGWHEILTTIYKDYMTPRRGKQLHDYPFYKKQEQLLAECILKERNSHN